MNDSSIAAPQYLGFILTNRCSGSCGHCLYNCGPHRRDSLDIETIRASLRDLRALGFGGTRIHLGGGEPFLVFPLLVEAVAAVREMGFVLDFVETSGAWYESSREAAEKLLILKAAGLERILVSVSPFHQSFVSPQKARAVLSLCNKFFGPENVIVNNLALLEDVERISPQKTISFDRYVRSVGVAHTVTALWQNSLPLHLAGRAAETMKPYLPRLPATSLEEPCEGNLLQSGKWHIEAGGLVSTGYCCGLAYPVGEQLADWYSGFSLADWPLTAMIVARGVHAFLEHASTEADFEPDPEGYVSACHACQDARLALWRKGGYPELAPDGFYEELIRTKRGARSG